MTIFFCYPSWQMGSEVAATHRRARGAAQTHGPGGRLVVSGGPATGRRSGAQVSRRVGVDRGGLVLRGFDAGDQLLQIGDRVRHAVAIVLACSRAGSVQSFLQSVAGVPFPAQALIGIHARVKIDRTAPHSGNHFTILGDTHTILLLLAGWRAGDFIVRIMMIRVKSMEKVRRRCASCQTWGRRQHRGPPRGSGSRPAGSGAVDG